jgi:hypothetical protein
MRAVRVFSDGDGESHFEDFEIELQPVDFAPPAPPLLLSETADASGFALMSCPPGWYGDWHPAPRRQWLLWLSGTTRIEVSDGEVREISAGTVMLSEDITGRGHRTWQIGDEPVLIAAIQIPYPAVAD